jgi:hypothetical protein
VTRARPAALSCAAIRGDPFRPLLGQQFTPDDLAGLLAAARQLDPAAFSPRPRDEVVSIDWTEPGIACTAGLYQGKFTFVNLRPDPGALTAGEVIACLGAPSQVQAWYDVYPGYGMGSLHAALVFVPHRVIAYAARHFSATLGDAVPLVGGAPAPALDERIPVHLLSIMAEPWASEGPVLASSAPWPGDWTRVPVDVQSHPEWPVPSGRDLSADALPPEAIPAVLDEIAAAFADAPRPPDEELAHPDSPDFDEVAGLATFAHWRDLPDDVVEGEWEALSFLSPGGFRHYLPAYMSWVLRHPDSGAAVVDATIFALTPPLTGPLASYMRSKYSLFDDPQRAAVGTFLRVMASFEDVRAALDYWT